MKAKLIFQGLTHRVIAVADSTAGYEDKYVIEVLGKNTLDEAQWTPVTEWRPAARYSSRRDEQPYMTALVAMLKEAIAKPNTNPITQASELTTLLGQ